LSIMTRLRWREGDRLILGRHSPFLSEIASRLFIELEQSDGPREPD